MTEHINSAFDTGLKEVNKQIAKLGALAETQLDDSLTALKAVSYTHLRAHET